MKIKIKKNFTKVAVIGLGYVGLELAVNISRSKFKVLGFDKNLDKINILKKNKSPIASISNKNIKNLDKNNIYNLHDIEKIAECDIIIITLPTPLTKKNRPDMSYIIKCFDLIFPYLRKNQMIILESTVYPGATKEIFERKLSKKFNIGKDFYLCFSPERISPGKKLSYKYNEIPKIVSGFSKNCLSHISLFYGKIFKKLFKASSIQIAEFTKLYENAFRAVNIGFVNQMKMISHKLNLDITEIIKAASTKPFGFTPFSPGPGVGGHCIPIDPLFISYVAKKNKVKSNFIELARDVNIETSDWVIDKIKKSLKEKDRIILLGVSYKKNIDDYRESPAIRIFEKLNKNYKVEYFDPYVPNIEIKNKAYYSIKDFNYKKLKFFSAVVIVADHDNFKYDKIIKNSKIIYDTRRVLKKYSSSKKIISL